MILSYLNTSYKFPLKLLKKNLPSSFSKILTFWLFLSRLLIRIEMQTCILNFLRKTTTFKIRFSNCASICLETMQMGLRHRGKFEMCACISFVAWTIWEQSRWWFVFRCYYPENHYKWSCEIILWSCKAALPLGILIYVCKRVCHIS